MFLFLFVLLTWLLPLPLVIIMWYGVNRDKREKNYDDLFILIVIGVFPILNWLFVFDPSSNYSSNYSNWIDGYKQIDKEWIVAFVPVVSLLLVFFII